jgi:hypothetical protein
MGMQALDIPLVAKSSTLAGGAAQNAVQFNH